MKQSDGESTQRVQADVRAYLKSDRFQQKYPKAFHKWVDAETMLWSSDSENQLTTIGHLCREAMQEFATALVETYQPSGVDENKAHDVARPKAILKLLPDDQGKSVKSFLDALLSYWGTVSDLVQRQEHGSQKEGTPLVWEDARRVVFQTAVVMFEVDRALSQLQKHNG